MTEEHAEREYRHIAGGTWRCWMVVLGTFTAGLAVVTALTHTWRALWGVGVALAVLGVEAIHRPRLVQRGCVRVTDNGLTVRDWPGRERLVSWDDVTEVLVHPNVWGDSWFSPYTVRSAHASPLRTPEGLENSRALQAALLDHSGVQQAGLDWRGSQVLRRIAP